MAELSTLARPYAKAAFEYAVAAGALDRWSQALGLLAALAGEDKIAVLLGAPNYTGRERATVLLEVCGDAFDSAVRNFLQLMAANDRLLLLPEVHEQFQALKANLERTVDISVTTANVIGDDQRERLAAALTKRLGRDVRIQVSIAPTLLGGALIRAGDTVIDGSLRGRLHKLADALLS
jgi:F-type H+-transporting ATPase subunit delta